MDLKKLKDSALPKISKQEFLNKIPEAFEDEYGEDFIVDGKYVSLVNHYNRVNLLVGSDENYPTDETTVLEGEFATPQELVSWVESNM